jgi:hypothetical protein
VTSLGRVLEAWSYPLSSVGGERIDSMDVTPAGVADDRRYVVIDASTPAPPTADGFARRPLIETTCSEAECEWPPPSLTPLSETPPSQPHLTSRVQTPPHNRTAENGA